VKYFSLKFITYQLLKFLLPRKYKNIFVKIFLKQSFDDHFFDRKYNVDSSSRELEGKEKLHTTFLAGSYKELKHSFNYLIKNCLEPKNINLVDLGCGRGRPLIYGITRGFNSVTGVELSKELTQSCLMNISKVKKIQKHNITSSEVHVLNVKNFVFRDEHNVIYCFNTPEIIKMIMQNLQISYQNNKRKIYLIWHVNEARGERDYVEEILSKHFPNFKLIHRIDNELFFYRKTNIYKLS
tara:strand:+ start:122 stop:838 length:717 start_codon:yes stop_codon:yes gene_type:complete